MAVIDIIPLWSAGRSETSDSGTNVTSGWSVLLDGTDDPKDAARVAETAAGIPDYGDQHATYTGLYARSISARVQNGRTFFIVEVTWSPPEEFGGTSSPVDPTTLDAVKAYRTYRSVEPIDQAISTIDPNTGGTVLLPPIMSNTYERFEPPVTIDKSDDLLVLTKNFATYNRSFWRGYKDSLNDDTWDGEATGTVRLIDYDFSEVIDGPWSYWRGEFQFAIRADGWLARRLNVGTRIKFASSPDQWVDITDDEGNPISRPVPLDWNTAEITDPTAGSVGSIADAPLSGTSDGKYLWLEYVVYESKDFDAMGLL